jgi:hypothetical protein
MRIVTWVAAAAALLIGAPVALAHEGSPNFLSQINKVTPAAGVDVEVLNRDDRLLLRNTGTESDPEAVTDKDVRTKIYDWEVPIEVDGRAGAITGTLFWTPLPSGGSPLPLIIGFAALVIPLGFAVVIARRLLAAPPAPASEAW